MEPVILKNIIIWSGSEQWLGQPIESSNLTRKHGCARLRLINKRTMDNEETLKREQAERGWEEAMEYQACLKAEAEARDYKATEEESRKAWDIFLGKFNQKTAKRNN